MLYFDNAATTFPKPPEVLRAVNGSFRNFGANPGRSGYPMSMDTAREVYRARSAAGEFFGAPPENVIFTRNCTESLNLVILSMLKEGGHCVISDLEHNSVLRPVYALSRGGNVSFDCAEVPLSEPEAAVESYRNLIRPDTKLVVATGASNVFGTLLPVKKIAALCAEYGIPFLLDAAQVAGSEEISLADGYNFIAAPGHKGLLGPMGTGLLILKGDVLPDPLMYGGTGSQSLMAGQPDELPERYESGTLNVPGILGLGAGVNWVKRTGRDTIRKREMEIAEYLYDALSEMERIDLFAPGPAPGKSTPVLSFAIEGKTGEETSALLMRQGIASRGGFHCAALAHRKMGTDDRGTCRLSVGPMNRLSEAESAVRKIYAIIKSL
ncbi:MAG TPA: aminotransferase class V-fold PLP-dependent enzyme [Oscillospiraceae bacterium]|nr:aminotransferase class V-fold PLP-dependent enzyme [Oscillospiraceae bacterium]HRW56796.1 aminotransferase class V-fold PLP-dependent enzyme [Oscillospiraceae bacterium]